MQIKYAAAGLIENIYVRILECVSQEFYLLTYIYSL